MPKVQCPGCQRQIGLTENHYGRKLKCKCGQVFRAPEKPAPKSVPVPSNLPPIQFSCTSCMTLLQVSADQAGQLSACPCGAHVQVPAAGDPLGLPPTDPFGFPANQVGMQPLVGSSTLPSSVPPPSQSPYHPGGVVSGRPKKKKGKSKNENTIFEGEIMGGIAMMLGAIIWFVGGLAFGITFIYPPILFLIGLGSLIKGLID